MTRIGVGPWFDEEDHDELIIEDNDTLTVFSDRLTWNGSTEGRVRIHFSLGHITGAIELSGDRAIRLGDMLKDHGERATGFDSP